MDVVNIILNKDKFNIGIVDGVQIINLTGLELSSKGGFKIGNEKIINIKVIDKDMAHILAYSKVLYVYEKLIKKLTGLVTSDDESGGDFREALNQIERFRLVIKNRYRAYLKQQELESMSKQLAFLKKTAQERIDEINSYFDELANGKSR